MVPTYSKDFDNIYIYIYNSNRSQLSNKWTNNWKNISVKLKSNETSNEHITNMNLWVESEVRLLKKNAINKDNKNKKREKRSLRKSTNKNYCHCKDPC